MRRKYAKIENKSMFVEVPGMGMVRITAKGEGEFLVDANTDFCFLKFEGKTIYIAVRFKESEGKITMDKGTLYLKAKVGKYAVMQYLKYTERDAILEKLVALIEPWAVEHNAKLQSNRIRIAS